MQMYVRNGRRSFAKYSKVQVKTDAPALLRKSEWLDWAPIFWGGSSSVVSPIEGGPGSFLPTAIQASFARSPAGIYFIPVGANRIAAKKPDAADLSKASCCISLAEKAGACSGILRKRREKLALLA